MPFQPEQPYTLDRIVRIGVSIALLWAFIALLGYLSDVLIPFAVALLMAYLLNPLVLWLQKRLKIKQRPPAVFLSLFLTVLLLAGISWLFLPTLAKEFSDMGRLIANYVNNSELRQQALQYLPQDFELFIQDLLNREEVKKFLNAENLTQAAHFLGQNILPGVWGMFTGSISLLLGILGLFVVFLYLIFVLLDYEKISTGWSAYLPPQFRGTVLTVLEDAKNAMNRYFRAQALVAFIVGTLHAIGFTIIGLPMGILLGLLIGMLNMVPYFQLIGFIPAILFTLMHALETGTNFWWMLMLVMLVFGIIQLIQDMILTPKIMGDVTGLNPAIILLSLSIWGKLLGMLGLIIALPMTTLLIAYYRSFLKKVEEKPKSQILFKPK